MVASDDLGSGVHSDALFHCHRNNRDPHVQAQISRLEEMEGEGN